ncbi:MAG: S-layer homology domain-containing protein [Ruminococcaceae bacterium]|nr:S-layer homology domain-containing protein [Oscillospiraceae bacterium]
MKKKIFGMIVTLIAVMMIVPLAISAADPSFSVEGSIVDGGAEEITVAVDGKATLTLKDVPATATITYNKGGDSNVGYTESSDKKSITIEGNEVTSSPVTINIQIKWEVTSGGKTIKNQRDLACRVNVVPKAITSFTVKGRVDTLKNGQPDDYEITLTDNLDFYVGDKFTVLSGKVEFNSGESKNVTADEFVVTGSDVNVAEFTAGQTGISFTLTTADPNQPKRSEIHTKAQNYRVHVVARETEVTLEKNPDYVKENKFVTVYDEGEKFDFNSIRLAVYYKNTTALKDHAYYKGAQGFNAEDVIMAVGLDEFTVYYNNEPHTFTFSELGVTTVAAKSVKPYIKAGGTEVYYYGDIFDFTTLELDVVEKGQSGEKTYVVKSNGFTPVSPKGRLTADDEGITIKYDTKTYTFKWNEIKLRDDVTSSVVVLEDNRVLKGIVAEGEPLKAKYTDGQTVKDWSGIKFYALYDVYDAATDTTKEVKKLLSENEIGNITAKPCEYSQYDPEKNTYVVIDYKEGKTTVRGYVYGFEIVENAVESIKVTTPPTKTEYENGDKLKLDGMKVTIYYTNGTSEVHSYDDPTISCSPAHGEEVSATTKAVTVVYKSGSVVKETKWEGLKVNSSVKIKKATISVKPDKMTYEVDESFDPTGIEVTIMYADMETPDTVYTDRDFNSFSRVFKSTKDNKVELTIKNPYNDKDSVKLTLEVEVTEKVVPKSIEDISYKKTYLEGEKISLEDITDYFVLMSDGTKITKEQFDDMLEDTTLASSKKPSITTTPATTTALKKTDKKFVVNFKYKGVTVKSEDLAIEVKTPVCVLSNTTNSTVTPYESLELALEAANELTTTQAKTVTITLKQDVELASKYQFNAERSIVIDLSGNDLTMSRTQLIVPHKSTYKNVEIELKNSASTDATIIYDKTDKDMQIILGKNDKLVIDWETEIPGIYEITLKAGDHGKISGPTEVAHGNDAKYTITPDEGYEVDTIFVDKKQQGKGTTITIQSVDDDHTIEVTFKEVVVEWVNPFTDVSKYANYYEAIQFVYENNLFKGVSSNKFEPGETMTRAMFVTVLGRLQGISENDSRYAGKSSFSDVKSSAATSWYVPYVEWASQCGLLLGYEDGTFRPDNEISHTEMYILMQRYAQKILGKTGSATGTRVTVSDAADIPTWEGAYEAVQYATKYNYLVTTSNKIKPNDDALRHELASLLKSFCDEFGLLQTTKK